MGSLFTAVNINVFTRVKYIFSPIITKFGASQQTFVKSPISDFVKIHLLETR